MEMPIHAFLQFVKVLHINSSVWNIFLKNINNLWCICEDVWEQLHDEVSQIEVKGDYRIHYSNSILTYHVNGTLSLGP